jgi:DNA-binding NarL/FixJ family response regulator
MSKTSVSIVEDNASIRASLERLLGDSPAYRCLGVSRTGTEALETIPKNKPDVVIMDIELPDISGIECTARLKRMFPELQILILTVYKDNEQIFKALEAGASGYLLKRSSSDEILNAIQDVRAGGAPMSGEIARAVIQSFRKPVVTNPEIQSLTPREVEILGFLAQGYVSKEIAEKLSISYETVRTHLVRVYQKLHVRSRTEAVIKYFQTPENPG